MDLEKAVRQTELFAGLTEDHCRMIIKAGRTLEVPRNQVIFFEKSTGDSFYILLSGSVKLYRLSEEGREIVVRILTGGEIFGEVVLYESTRYPVTAETVTDCRLFTVAREAFQSLMENRDFRDKFIAAVMRKQRYLSNRIHYLSAFDVEERFFQFLAENYGKKDQYTLNLSKKDIASAVGTIPATLSRLIHRLKTEGVITWEKKKLAFAPGFWENWEKTNN